MFMSQKQTKPTVNRDFRVPSELTSDYGVDVVFNVKPICCTKTTSYSSRHGNITLHCYFLTQSHI